MYLFLPGNASQKRPLFFFLGRTCSEKAEPKTQIKSRNNPPKKIFGKRRQVEIIKLNYSYFLASSLQCIYVRPSRGCLAFGGSARFILQPGNPAWFEVARTVGSSPPWITTLIHPITSSTSKLLRIMFVLYILWIDIENLQPSFDWAKIIGKNNIQNLNLQHPKKQKLWSSRTEEALQQREREREREYVHSLLYCSCYNQKRPGKTWIDQNVLQPPIERYCFINVSKNHQSLRKKKHSQKKIMIIILTHHVGGNCKLLARGARRTMNQNWRALGRW